MKNRHALRVVQRPRLNAVISDAVASVRPAALSPRAPLTPATLADLLCLLQSDTPMTPDEANAASRMALGMRRVPAGGPLIHMGAPSEAIYFVYSGSFKVFRIDEEGHEQVLAFAGRQEILAFDALCLDAHPSAASALEDATVFVVQKRELLALSRAVPAFGLELQRAGSRALTRTSALLDVMAAVLADVRLARFLLQLSCQLTEVGRSPQRLLLRMGRRDIARTLGLAPETISRSFTALITAQLIQVNGRAVDILDLERLKTHSRTARRSPDGLGTPPARLQALRQRSGFDSSGLRSLAA